MATKAPPLGDAIRETFKSMTSEASELLTLNLIAALTGLVIVAVGMVELSLPGSLIAIVRSALTPNGMYLLAAMWALLGLVVLVAAGSSRMPRTMRIFGVLLILSAVVTPLIGFEGSRGAMDWFVRRGDRFTRLVAFAVLLGGGCLVYASGPSRRRV
jgi:uncharacterized membrane protein